MKWLIVVYLVIVVPLLASFLWDSHQVQKAIKEGTFYYRGPRKDGEA